MCPVSGCKNFGGHGYARSTFIDHLNTHCQKFLTNEIERVRAVQASYSHIKVVPKENDLHIDFMKSECSDGLLGFTMFVGSKQSRSRGKERRSETPLGNEEIKAKFPQTHETWLKKRKPSKRNLT